MIPVRIALISLFLLLAAGPAFANAQPLTDAELVGKLNRGGFNIYVRHAATDWSQTDYVDVPEDWSSCDPKQVRQLSDAGRRNARALGQALRALEIPIGRVISSPYCRARETAQLIAGKEPSPTSDLMNLRVEELVGGRDAAVRRARDLLSEAPAEGVNDLFAAHGNLGRAAFDEYLSEGEFMVIEPRGDRQFAVLGTLSLRELEALAE